MREPLACELAYLMLHSAQEAGLGDLGEVESEKLLRLEKTAKAAFVLQERILSTPEAAEVVTPDSEIESAIKQLRTRYQDEAAFEADLAANNLTIAQLEHTVKRDLRVDAVLQKISMGEVCNEDQAYAYYQQHPEKFRQPEQRQVRHILITVNAEYAENSEEAALERIRTLAENLQNAPEQFAEKAAVISECPSALKGGEIGAVTRGTLYAELDAVLFAMSVGEVSDPVRSDMGWHLLLCEAIHPQEAIPYASVKKKIQAHVLELKAKKKQRAWIASLADL